MMLATCIRCGGGRWDGLAPVCAGCRDDYVEAVCQSGLDLIDQAITEHKGCQKAVDDVKAHYVEENGRLREALELIARGVWTAPNSVETIVYVARRALSQE